MHAYYTCTLIIESLCSRYGGMLNVKTLSEITKRINASMNTCIICMVYLPLETSIRYLDDYHNSGSILVWLLFITKSQHKLFTTSCLAFELLVPYQQSFIKVLPPQLSSLDSLFTMPSYFQLNTLHVIFCCSK